MCTVWSVLICLKTGDNQTESRKWKQVHSYKPDFIRNTSKTDKTLSISKNNIAIHSLNQQVCISLKCDQDQIRSHRSQLNKTCYYRHSSFLTQGISIPTNNVMVQCIKLKTKEFLFLGGGAGRLFLNILTSPSTI